MAGFNKFNAFTTDLTNGKHDFSSHTYKVMLTNVAPVATNSIKGNLTEIAAGNGYTAGGTAVTITKSNSSGTEKIVVSSDITFTAAGGSIGPFRYAVLYNDTQASPAKPLVGFWDYGSSVTLNDTETFTVDFDQTNGVIQVA
jgi:hypothetical protein